MIKVACLPANQNATLITQPGLKELGFKDEVPSLKAFGVSVGTEMTVVPGRILPRPIVRYANSGAAVDERASWNMRNVKFHKGAKLEKWGVLVIKDGNPRDEVESEEDPVLNNVLSGFTNMCKASGMAVDGPPVVRLAVHLPRKTREDPIRRDAVQAIQKKLLELRSMKIAKPKIFLVSGCASPVAFKSSHSAPLGHVVERRQARLRRTEVRLRRDPRHRYC
jgi:eukaryotic translation initiation factor 2C